MREFRDSVRAWKEGRARYLYDRQGCKTPRRVCRAYLHVWKGENAQKKRLWYKYDWMYRAMLKLIGERLTTGKLEFITWGEQGTLAELCAVGGIKTARKRLEWYEGLTEFVFVTEGREALKRQMLLDSGGRD